MIIGIGHDLVEIARVRAILDGRTGSSFLARVLTPEELSFACAAFGEPPGRRWAEYAAGRFAAKEAVVKALGCGIGAIVGFRDIAVRPDDAGKPCCILTEPAYARLGRSPSGTAIHVSITHTAELASAVAVVEDLRAN